MLMLPERPLWSGLEPSQAPASEQQPGMLQLGLPKPPALATRHFISRRELTTFLAFFIIAAAGCGDGKIKIVGKLSKGGEPLTGRVHMVFEPVTADNAPPANHYFANIRADGSYTVAGKQGTGIPPGKYRIALTVLDKPALLKGAFDKGKSPIIRDVTAKPSTQTIDIELDQPGE